MDTSTERIAKSIEQAHWDNALYDASKTFTAALLTANSARVIQQVNVSVEDTEKALFGCVEVGLLLAKMLMTNLNWERPGEDASNKETQNESQKA